MSDEASAIARNHSRSQGTARLVLLGIANHDSDGGASIHMATLATYANVTQRNAQKAVERLAGHTAECEPGCREHLDVPEIERVVNAGGRLTDTNHERPNLYRFLLECPPACDRTKNHRVRCTLCGEPVPHDRRWVGAHMRCELKARLAGGDTPDAVVTPLSDATGGNPLSDATPPVGSDIRSKPRTETERDSYVSERAGAHEDEGDRWAMRCPANTRAGVYLEHRAGRHGRCTLCGARLAGDGTFQPVGVVEGSRPRLVVAQPALEGVTA